jgi:glutathione S-transferase
MTTLVLHHYPMSPYAEKIRTMLGYTGLAWQSVRTREMPPRPKLALLAGGYRRIPVAQIGSDIFCDTRIIASEIAAASAKPLLDFANLNADEQNEVVDVESRLFFASVMTGSTLVLNRKVWRDMPVLDIGRFLWDRVHMGLKAKGPALSLRQARPMVLAHLNALEPRLERQWLHRDQPTLVDFAVYHGLWFMRDLGECGFMEDFPNTLAWMDRIRAFGYGTPESISADDALVLAHQSTPRRILANARKDALLGQQVSIVPADYGQVPTEGELVGSGPERWIIARETPETGRVHVHFPKQGYLIRA